MKAAMCELSSQKKCAQKKPKCCVTFNCYHFNRALSRKLHVLSNPGKRLWNADQEMIPALEWVMSVSSAVREGVDYRAE